jgi:hypothetical protein
MDHLNTAEKKLLQDIKEEKEDVVQVGKTGESSQDEGLEGQKTYNGIF